MATEGFDIAVVDLRSQCDPAVLESIRAHGGRAEYFCPDIADLARHAPVLGEIRATLGRTDGLVNNAGIAARPLTDIMDLSAEAFDRNISINFRSTFFLTQAFIGQLLEAMREGHEPKGYKSSAIISSIAHQLVSTERAQYQVAKSALSTVTQLLAARLAAEEI